MLTNDTPATYHHQGPGRKPPYWILVALAVCLALQLVWAVINLFLIC